MYTKQQLLWKLQIASKNPEVLQSQVYIAFKATLTVHVIKPVVLILAPNSRLQFNLGFFSYQ